MSYDISEQEVLLNTFTEMLRAVTEDGGRKRERGEKPPWWRDPAHMAAVWSHFRKRELGQLKDNDSGAHPYVHAAWRLLAVAYQETNGQCNPAVALDRMPYPATMSGPVEWDLGCP